MAAITLEKLRATIRFRGDYQNVRKFPNADVDTEIQIAFKAFWQLVADEHQGYWDTEGNVTTTASVAYVALPTDAWRVQGVDIYEGTTPRQLKKVGVGKRNHFGPETGTPDAYRLAARGINLYPTPNAVYTLRVMYTPLAPALSASQPREYYNGWEDYVLEATLAVLDSREGKPIGERMTKLERIEKAVKAGVSQHDSQEPEYLNLREGGVVDPYEDF